MWIRKSSLGLAPTSYVSLNQDKHQTLWDAPASSVKCELNQAAGNLQMEISMKCLALFLCFVGVSGWWLGKGVPKTQFENHSNRIVLRCLSTSRFHNLTFFRKWRPLVNVVFPSLSLVTMPFFSNHSSARRYDFLFVFFVHIKHISSKRKKKHEERFQLASFKSM